MIYFSEKRNASLNAGLFIYLFDLFVIQFSGAVGCCLFLLKLDTKLVNTKQINNK